MKNRRFSLTSALMILVALSVLLAGCTATAAGPSAVKQPTATPAPTPAAGQANMTGLLLSQNDEKPMANIAVRLAQIYRQEDQGAFVLDLARSPGAYTDANGNFFIVEITPGEYYVVVGEPADNNYVIFQDKDQKPISFVVAADKVVDVGVVKVNFVP